MMFEICAWPERMDWPGAGMFIAMAEIGLYIGECGEGIVLYICKVLANGAMCVASTVKTPLEFLKMYLPL
jgi:hypothetical protein